MRHILLIFLLSLIPLSAQAIIPLELIAEYEIFQDQSSSTRSAGWDAQHFFNDFTVTIVWFGRHDTLYYDLGDGNGVHVLPLHPPTQLPDGYGFAFYKNPFMYKLAAEVDLPKFGVTAILSRGANNGLYKTYAINLETGEVDSPLFDAGWTDTSQIPHVSASGDRYEAWPHLPAVTRRFIVLRNTARYDWSEGDVWSESYSGEVSIYAVPSFEEITHRDSCTAFTILPGLETPVAVFAGGFQTSLEWPCDSTPDDYCWFHESLRTIIPTSAEAAEVCHVVNSMENPDYEYCYPSSSIAAAQDASGNKYAIIDTACYDAVSGSLVWSNASLLPVFAGFNFPEPDRQYLFSKNWGSNTFNVYDPATGHLIDETSSYEGIYRYALNLTGGLGEFVTRSTIVGQPISPVRIYRVGVLPPQRLIIQYLPQHNYIWLAWDPVPGATAYRVCRMYEYNEVGNCDDVFTVTTTATQFTLDPNRPQEFYTVSAVFE